MKEDIKKYSIPVSISVNFCRVMLGLVFMFSGIVKAIDPVGSQIKLSDYLYSFGLGGILLDSTLLIMACLLAGFEILIGSYLVVGVFSKGSPFLALRVMAVFPPFTLYLAIMNPVEDCGCFGDALVLTNWQTFWKNVFLLSLALFVYVKRKAIVPFVAEKRQWIVTVVMVAITVKFMTVNVKGLPILDFRPYKVGTDLRKEILENRNPLMHDFCIMDDDMNDLTANIIGNSGYTFMLVSPHLEDASEDNLDLIDDVFDYCEHWGYDFIGVTASGSRAVMKWTENAGADIPFLFCDEIPLQTMVRSNPGLVLIKDGILVNKWSDSHIPSDEELYSRLEELEVGSVPSPDPFHSPWAVALLFMAPLVLIVLIDRLKGLIQ